MWLWGVAIPGHTKAQRMGMGVVVGRMQAVAGH